MTCPRRVFHKIQHFRKFRIESFINLGNMGKHARDSQFLFHHCIFLFHLNIHYLLILICQKKKKKNSNTDTHDTYKWLH